MPYKKFDRNQLRLKPLCLRRSLLDLSVLLSPRDCPVTARDEKFTQIARSMVSAREKGASIILMMGAHLLRAGAARLIIELMEKGLISHVGMNGAGPIHDFEMALAGCTTESVEEYIRDGEFGLWNETGRINQLVTAGRAQDLGFGEALGKGIAEGDYPHKEISVYAAGYRNRIPVTAHIGIGYDINHEHPSCDGSDLGAASYDDFLILAESVANLEGGVLLNFGTAVMGPEVYLKALAMARNVASGQGHQIRHFTTAVFDLHDLGDRVTAEPSRDDPKYYFRPLKTILVRTVKDGGRSFYCRGDHRETFPKLYSALRHIGGTNWQ
jgi:hypothetical protein